MKLAKSKSWKNESEDFFCFEIENDSVHSQVLFFVRFWTVDSNEKVKFDFHSLCYHSIYNSVFIAVNFIDEISIWKYLLFFCCYSSCVQLINCHSAHTHTPPPSPIAHWNDAPSSLSDKMVSGYNDNCFSYLLASFHTQTIYTKCNEGIFI